MASTGLTGARRFQAALALDPFPASKVQSHARQFAEIDKHNFIPDRPGTGDDLVPWLRPGSQLAV
jgi:hypothetical protein